MPLHVIMPELGISLPGCTIVCGDSHTSSNGAVGSLAWGIGALEVEHVLATQTVVLHKPNRMRIRFNGKVAAGISVKDMILYTIGRLGSAAGRGFVVEYSGDGISALAMDCRLTICNMAIEMGARAGLIAPDQTTFDHLAGRGVQPNPRRSPDYHQRQGVNREPSQIVTYCRRDGCAR